MMPRASLGAATDTSDRYPASAAGAAVGCGLPAMQWPAHEGPNNARIGRAGVCLTSKHLMNPYLANRYPRARGFRWVRLSLWVLWVWVRVGSAEPVGSDPLGPGVRRTRGVLYL